MKFSRLSASIANNADEAPSIYMAICMVESLLDDIEDATGQEISGLPIGDDTLPTKMVWLCQAINQIYEEKGTELIRNRNRLDAAMKELNKVSTELESLSETAVRLSAVKIDLKEKQTALARVRAEREAYETIKEQCRQLQLEADSLQGFDQAAEEAKLRALQAETAKLSEVKSGLDAELAAVLKARDELVGKTAELRSELDQTAALLEQKNNALGGMEKQRLEARRRERELADQLREATEALSGLQDAVSRLQTETIPERKRQLDDEEARKASLEQTLASIDLEIGQLLAQNQELCSKIERAKEELNAHSGAYSHLTEDYKQKSEESAALARRLEDLKGKNDAQKYEIYRRQMAEQIAELETMGQECAAMEQELAELGQTAQAKRRRVEELSEKKAQAEGVERQISDVLRKLDPIASEDFITKLERNRQRLVTLENVRENLSSTLSDMREILGEMPVNDSGAALDRMKDTLQGLLNYTDKLQKNLVMYAKSVALEEEK